MNNSKSGLVGIISFLAMTVASVALLGAGSRPASASVVAPTADTVVVLPEQVITASAPAYVVDYSAYQVKSGPKRAVHAAPAVRTAAPVAAPRTVVRELEQGGMFGVGTSSTQTVRCTG
jgi:hypothetical protein